MSYYTKYTLEIYDDHAMYITDKNIKCKIAYSLRDINGCEFSDINTIDDIANISRKWDDDYLDMRKLSRKFPSYVFCLRGFGEDQLDIWQEFFKNGESISCGVKYDVPVSVRAMFKRCDLDDFSYVG